MTLTLDSKIRAAYVQRFPEDELGREISPRLTFRILLISLLKKQDVYKALGVEDSIIREQVFQMLSGIIGCNYDFVYELWFDAA